MPDNAAKKWEREVAHRLGGQRTGPQGFGLPDVKGVPLAPECKLMGRIALKGAHLNQARTNAARVGLPWVLAIKKRIKQGEQPEKLVVMDFDMFVDWYNALHKSNYFGGNNG